MEFNKIVSDAFIEWKENNSCKEAKALNRLVGTEYFDTAKT
jgi:hypothetical protein